MSETPLPSSAYAYGKIVGRIISAVGDLSDADDVYPDAVPITATGVITFTPSSVTRVVTSTVPSTLVQQRPIVANLDANGYISLNNQQGVWLYTGVWTVSFGTSLGLTAFQIEVTTAYTDLAPLDLFAVAPYIPSGGAAITTMLVPASPVDGRILMWSSSQNGLVWSSGYQRMYTPQMYGALGDGSHDDTLAVQAAFDAALGGPAGAAPAPLRAAIGMVYIPPGIYRCTATISVVSALGLNVVGAGRRLSIISFSGAITGNGLEFIGTPALTLSDLTIKGIGGYAGLSSVSASALALDYTPAQSEGWGAGATINRVYVEDLKFKYGISLGMNSGTYDLSDVALHDCSVIGNFTPGSSETTWWQEGFRSGSGASSNVLNHHYDHCIGYSLRNLLRIVSVNSVTARAMNAARTEVAFQISGQSKFHLIASRVETSSKLLHVEAGGNLYNLVTMESVVWDHGGDTLTDKTILRFWSLGALTLRDCVFMQDATTDPWVIQPSTQEQTEREIHVTLENIVAPNTTAQSLFSVPNLTKCRAEVRNLITLTNSGASGNYVTQKLYYNSPMPDLADDYIGVVTADGALAFNIAAVAAMAATLRGARALGATIVATTTVSVDINAPLTVQFVATSVVSVDLHAKDRLAFAVVATATMSVNINQSQGLALSQIPWEGGPAYWSPFSKASASGWTNPNFFPISVFLSPAEPAHVTSYKDAGINVYMSVEHSPGVYPLTNITSQGMFAMPQVTEWTPAEVGTGNNAAVGWFITDELEMGMNSANPNGTEADFLAEQTAWVNQARGYADGRFCHANFGNGILRTFWAVTTMAQHEALMDSASADKYTYTSPDVADIIDGAHDAPDWPNGVPVQRAYSYGWQTDQMRRFQNQAALKPIWTFVETARPYLNEAGAGTITPDQIEGAVWSALIHEARGIAYFQHNNDATYGGNYSIRDITVVHNKVKAINAKVTSLAPVLNTQSYYNTSYTVNGFTYYRYRFNNGTDTMVKTYNGYCYIFAALGMRPNDDACTSGTVDTTGSKTFNVPAGVTGTLVTVVGESRTINVSGGSFSDTFANEYTHHVYQIAL